MRSEGAVQEKAIVEVSELEIAEMPEVENGEVAVKEEGQDLTFAALMNPEFIRQFKGCWHW
jgi:hypothetical protein